LFSLARGLVFGLSGGLAGGLIFGLVGVPGELAGVTSPRAVLARDRHVAFLLMFAGGLVSGLFWGLVFGLFSGLVGGLADGVAGGLATRRWMSMRRTAWPSYALIRGWLAFHHRLPWSLMSFLADAHQRGV
jgi:hypothetical protein